MTATGSKLIGRTATVRQDVDQWAGHWGTITHFDGRYHVSGGSIGDTLAPVFDLDELIVQRKQGDRRTDTHRPAALNPSEYEYVAPEQVRGVQQGDLAACEFQLAMRERIRQHMARTGGTYSHHSHGGNCMVCGNAMATYTVLFYHRPTNTYVRMGERCAEHVDASYDRSECAALRREHKHYAEFLAGKTKAQGVLAAAGVADAWAIYETAGQWPDDNCASQRHTVRDIVGKLVRYGSVTDKQLGLIGLMLTRIADAPAIEARRAAERAAAADAPKGRHTFTVIVLSRKVQESDFGDVTKMLVRHESGWRAYGTEPRAIEVKRGDVLSLTATFEPSEKDTKFAFFARPIATITEAAPEPATPESEQQGG